MSGVVDEVVLYDSAARAGGSKKTVKGRASVDMVGATVVVLRPEGKTSYPMHRVHEIRWGVEQP